MKLHIDGQVISLADLRAAWQSPTSVIIGKSAARRIATSNAHIISVLAGGEQVYGVNTGCGQLAQRR
jgi:histidine ammonia-lyase